MSKHQVFHRSGVGARPALLWIALVALIALLWVPTTLAQPSTDPDDVAYDFDPDTHLEPSGGDVSVKLLEGILGPVVARVRLASPLVATDTGAFGGMFALFNGFMLFLLAISLFVKFVAAFLDTAHEGESLGRDRSTTWTPIRIFIAVAMLIPMVNGYSLIQIICIWTTLAGVGLADGITNVAIDQLSSTAIYTEPPPPQARNLAVAMLASNICEQVVDTIPARGESNYEVRMTRRAGTRGSYEERYVRWGVKGMGAAACGGFVIREPHKDISADKNWVASEGSWLDSLLSWLKDLFTFGSKTREQFGDRLMVAHEDAGMRMRQELQPLAARIVAGQGNLQDCGPDITGGLAHTECISLLDIAAENYVRNLKASILDIVDQAGERAFTEFTGRAKDEGWLTLGSWFYRLNALTDYMNKLALNVPKPMIIYAWQRMPKEDVETYQQVISRLEAVVNQAETDSSLGLTDGDPNNSELDDFSRGFLRIMMEWFGDGVFGNVHPLFAISWMGHTILAILFTAFFGGKLVGIAFAPASKLVDAAAGGLSDLISGNVRSSSPLSLLGLIVGLLVLGLIAFALMAAIYLPLVPFIIWIVGVLHWLILVFEALLAAPIWAVWHIRNGKGFTAEAMNGYLLLFSLLLRPALMVFGLIGATVISFYLVSILAGLFMVAAINAASGNFTGPIVVAGSIMVFVIVAVEITMKCFSLIHRLPDFVLRWIGGAMENSIDAADMRARSEGAMRQAADGATTVIGASAGRGKSAEVGRPDKEGGGDKSADEQSR